MPGTTPTYGLRYDELGDPPDGAGLGENLATDVESELERIDATVATFSAPNRCRLELTADYTVTTGPPAGVLPFGAAGYDTGGMATGSPYDTITIPADGVYALAANVKWPGSGFTKACIIQVNGMAKTGNSINTGASGSDYNNNGCAITLPLFAGDIVQLRVRHESASNQDVQALQDDAQAGTFLQAVQVCPL